MVPRAHSKWACDQRVDDDGWEVTVNIPVNSIQIRGIETETHLRIQHTLAHTERESMCKMGFYSLRKHTERTVFKIDGNRIAFILSASANVLAMGRLLNGRFTKNKKIYILDIGSSFRTKQNAVFKHQLTLNGSPFYTNTIGMIMLLNTFWLPSYFCINFSQFTKQKQKKMLNPSLHTRSRTKC